MLRKYKLIIYLMHISKQAHIWLDWLEILKTDFIMKDRTASYAIYSFKKCISGSINAIGVIFQ